jgi:hypothetical protein
VGERGFSLAGVFDHDELLIISDRAKGNRDSHRRCGLGRALKP